MRRYLPDSTQKNKGDDLNVQVGASLDGEGVGAGEEIAGQGQGGFAAIDVADDGAQGLVIQG